jgi:hypothetical protein
LRASGTNGKSAVAQTPLGNLVTFSSEVMLCLPGLLNSTPIKVEGPSSARFLRFSLPRRDRDIVVGGFSFLERS